ncbi:hypothetical protein [Bifidobacterium crudilactis]|jgi:hypothetical protein|uniref:hypothetical protein n=1 Tax=Bifidobacterium crudilactis TaxID=327277 RepID=UPI002F355738
MIDEEAEAFREKIRKYDITPLEEINSDGNGRISWVSPKTQAPYVTVGLFSMGADCFTIDE